VSAGRLALRNTLVRLVVWTAFIALGVVGVARTGLTDGPAGGVFATAQSIIERQTIAIDGNTALVGPLDGPASGLAYANNHYVASAEPGAALLAVPAAWVGVPLADSLNEPGAAVLLVGVLTVLLALLAAVALGWAGVRLGLPPPLALIAAAIGAGALLFPVGALTNAVLLCMFTAVLLALILADGADERVEAGWTPHGRLTLAGLLLGCLPFAIWSGWAATAVIGLTLIVQGGRRWWLRIPWLALGALPPLTLLALYNTAWYGRPWRAAWLYAIGDPWQRTLHGRYLNTPLTALNASLHATGVLVVRHPLLVLGWIGLGIGLLYVPWRARIATALLFVTLAAPAFIERQPAGIVAEQRGIIVLVPFAAAGYLLLIALVARERPVVLPWAILAGLACIAAGAVVSVATHGARLPVIVAVGNDPAVYVAPIALCAGVVALLIVPGLHVPRVRSSRAGALTGVAILLLVSLPGCGASASPRDVTTNPAPNLLPPVSTRLSSGVIAPLWTLDANAQIATDGVTLTAPKQSGTVTSPRVPVQEGDDYLLSAHVVLAQSATAAVETRIAWFDARQQPIGESVAHLNAGLPSQGSAAPPGAGYATVSLAIPAGALIDTIRLQPRDGGRIDALPNYAKAALAFSFDFETAMGGLIHTRGGATDHDVADAVARGLAMRQGAAFLRGLFAAYDTRGTFYVNGYNFLTGNTEHRQFVGNPTYTRYTAKTAGFASDYWATHPWYGDDPFGTEQSDPAWYFGSLTKQLAQDGNDIESHTFGHLFLHAGITPQQLDDDLTAWDALAKETGYAPAHSFAFPWGASNSLTAEYYAVLAKHGITNVTRFYDNKPGTVQLNTVPVYPQIRVVPDQELIDRQGDEAAADRGIDTALASGGVFSIWAHPENIATANAQAIWGRVVAYAADRRSLGLWVAPVTTITNFADARDNLHLSSVHVGANTVITVRNGGTTRCNDATLTLPGQPKQVGWTGGSGARDVNGAQLRIGNMAPGETVTIEVRYP
jgi:peptidoglycan/xylan/chitin deacetylase (PgdA/CDA1 family)